MLHILRFLGISLVCNGNHYDVMFLILYMSCIMSLTLNINEVFINIYRSALFFWMNMRRNLNIYFGKSKEYA